MLATLLTVCLAAYGQDPAPAVRMFLDCSYHCDETFLRKEITFVDWMRDRKDADVHVLIMTQSTGGGGTEYSIK